MPECRNEVMLPGILEKFDMPQVYQALCPGTVAVFNSHLADRSLAKESDIEKMNNLVLTTYKALKRKNAWHIAKVEEQERKRIIISSLMDD